eukprot:TRINITY_DN6309_c0_g1_i1.p1 TRINITY_DN6309_c0_g1~~TRINITY_DN6309_c0_g1_i1.p1  ORF type:complete len:395 (+),score=101.77 TRINITY_DN6309_c0_g1_i1:29-1213(+)
MATLLVLGGVAVGVPLYFFLNQARQYADDGEYVATYDPEKLRRAHEYLARRVDLGKNKRKLERIEHTHLEQEDGSFGALRLFDLNTDQYHIVTLDSKIAIGDALARLKAHRILAAPVVKRHSPGILSRKKEPRLEFIGYCSVTDVLDFAMDHCDGGDNDALHRVLSKTSLDDMLRKNVTNRSKWVSLPVTGRMQDAVDLMAAENIHRVALHATYQDENGKDITKISGLVTQTDIVTALVNHLRAGDVRFNFDFEQPVATSGLWTSAEHVQTIGSDACAWDALIQMRAHEPLPAVSSLAVVEQGAGGGDRFLGSISAHDFKGVSAANIDLLALPVLEFTKGTRAGTNSVQCSSDSSVLHTLQLMTSRHVYRCWIVDDGVLRGVVSMSDVIACLAQ